MISFIKTRTTELFCIILIMSISGCGDSLQLPDAPDGQSMEVSGSANSSNDPVTQQANAAPSISGTPTVSLEVGDYYLFMPQARDKDGDPLTFAINNKPDWAAFDPATGALTGIPKTADIGVSRSIEISVSDGSKTTDLERFSIRVEDTLVTLGSIVLSWIPPTENEDGSSLDDLAKYKIYFGQSPQDLDSVIRVRNPGINTYVIEELAPGTYFIGLTALNSDGVESDMSNLVEVVVS